MDHLLICFLLKKLLMLNSDERPERPSLSAHVPRRPSRCGLRGTDELGMHAWLESILQDEMGNEQFLLLGSPRHGTDAKCVRVRYRNTTKPKCVPRAPAS
jgi:hypothetical protein